MKIAEKILAEMQESRRCNQEILKQLQTINKDYPLFLNRAQTAITIATATKPQDPDVIANAAAGQTGYDAITVYDDLHRLAPVIYLMNDGTGGAGTLYAVSTSDGGIHWSGESEVLVHEFRAFYNVYEIRVRSPALVLYRVSEYMPAFLA